MQTPQIAQLRDREAKTAAALRDIYGHQRRLQVAQKEREVALAKIRAQLALHAAPLAPDGHGR